jgi:hypothetical protein
MMASLICSNPRHVNLRFREIPLSLNVSISFLLIGSAYEKIHEKFLTQMKIPRGSLRGEETILIL